MDLSGRLGGAFVIRDVGMPAAIAQRWEQRDAATAAMHAVLLGGAASETERAIGEYVRDHADQIADMAGDHCRLVIVGFGQHDGVDDSENPYDLARGLGVELATLPAVVALTEVGAKQALVVAVGDAIAASPATKELEGDDRWARFFRALFDACDDACAAPPPKRLGVLNKELRKGLASDRAKPKGRLDGLARLIDGFMDGASG